MNKMAELPNELSKADWAKKKAQELRELARALEMRVEEARKSINAGVPH